MRPPHCPAPRHAAAPSGRAAPSGPTRATPRREVIPIHPQHSSGDDPRLPERDLRLERPSEYEIHLITKTHGSFIAGDHIGTFGPGHVSIIGPNLPHDWVSDLVPGQVAVDRDAVIQFTDEWIRGCMQLLPGLQDVEETLKRSTRGLVFTGATAWSAAEQITSVVSSHGPERVGHLFAPRPDGASPRRGVADRGQRVDGPSAGRRRPERG